MGDRQEALDYLEALRLSLEQPHGRWLSLESVKVDETVERIDDETQIVTTTFTQVYKDVHD